METSLQPDQGELISLAQAAEQLDVHYMTAYRYVRTGRMFAEKNGGKWWVTPADLRAVLDEGTGRRTAGAAPANRKRLVDPLISRLVAGDTAGCWDLISDALGAGATPAEIHLELLNPALTKIGDRWHAGELSIADEHRATASAYRLLGQLGPLFRHRGRRRGCVIVGTVEGDMHALPTAMLADLLSDRHLDVIDLGANTPISSFIDAAQTADNLVGIGLCVLLDERADVALATATTVRAEFPDVLLVVGGPAAQGGHNAAFAAVADLVSGGAQDACDAFDRRAADRIAKVEAASA